MSTTIESEHFVEAILYVLEEAFKPTGEGRVFLDGGDSLFETLEKISADTASIPVGGQCATLAAQVKHVAFYLEVVESFVRNPGGTPPPDWGEIWRTVGAVSEEEWAAIQAELQLRYENIISLIKETPEWPTPRHIGGPIGVIAHTAYHLGEIRQALCTLVS